MVERLVRPVCHAASMRGQLLDDIIFAVSDLDFVFSRLFG